MKNDFTHIETLLIEGQLRQALQETISIIKDKEAYKEAIVLSGRLSEIEKQTRMGTMTHQAILTERNRLAASLFDLIQGIKDGAEPEPVPPQNPIKGLALVIGCGNYAHASPLPQPIHDSNELANELAKMGYWTVVRKENPNLREMKVIMDDFASELPNYDVGLFYFSGHAIQVKGLNFLVPVDADLRNERYVDYDCINLGRILSQMGASSGNTGIVLLEACRDNPFEKAWGRGIHGQGLAPCSAPPGTFIGYAAAPGQTAMDSTEKHDHFTAALLQQLPQNGSIHDMFQALRREVIEATGQQQIPWESSSLTESFAFVTP